MRPSSGEGDCACPALLPSGPFSPDCSRLAWLHQAPRGSLQETLRSETNLNLWICNGHRTWTLKVIQAPVDFRGPELRGEWGPALQAALPGHAERVGSARSSGRAAGVRLGQMGCCRHLPRSRQQLALPLTHRCLREPKSKVIASTAEVTRSSHPSLLPACLQATEKPRRLLGSAGTRQNPRLGQDSRR